MTAEDEKSFLKARDIQSVVQADKIETLSQTFGDIKKDKE